MNVRSSRLLVIVLASVVVVGAGFIADALASPAVSGYAWNGTTSQGVVKIDNPKIIGQAGAISPHSTEPGIAFNSSLTESAVFVSTVWFKATCTFILPGKPAVTPPSPWWPVGLPKNIAVHKHRFSSTQPNGLQRLLLPNVTVHLTGTINGTSANGTARWTLIPSARYHCSPTSGAFTWKAHRSPGKVEVGNLG